MIIGSLDTTGTLTVNNCNGCGGGGSGSSPASPLGSYQIYGSATSLASIPGVLSATAFPGAECGAQISAAINAMPSTGGTVDARGYVPNTTCTTPILASKPVHLLFGPGVITLSPTPGDQVAGIKVSAPNVVIECTASTALQLAPTGTVLTSGTAVPLIGNFADAEVSPGYPGSNAYHTSDGTEVVNCDLNGNSIGTFGIFAPNVYTMKVRGNHVRGFASSDIFMLGGQNNLDTTITDSAGGDGVVWGVDGHITGLSQSNGQGADGWHFFGGGNVADGPTAYLNGLHGVHLDGVPAADWSASHTFVEPKLVLPTVGNAGAYLYYTLKVGETAGSRPTWPQQVGVTVADGGVTWICVGNGNVYGLGRVLPYGGAQNMNSLNISASNQANASGDWDDILDEGSATSYNINDTFIGAKPNQAAIPSNPAHGLHLKYVSGSQVYGTEWYGGAWTSPLVAQPDLGGVILDHSQNNTVDGVVCAQPYENCVQFVASGLNVIQNVSSENGGVAATPTAGTFAVSIDATSFTTRLDGVIAVDNRVTPYQRGISAASGSFGIVAHNYTAIGTATGDLLGAFSVDSSAISSGNYWSVPTGARFSWATGNFPGAAEAMNLQATGLYLDSGVALNLPLSDGCLQISSGAVTSTPCQLPTPGPSTLGGVNSKDCSALGGLQKINTDGSVSCPASNPDSDLVLKPQSAPPASPATACLAMDLSNGICEYYDSTSGPSLEDTSGNVTRIAQKFFGTAAPGSVTGNLPGDTFSDTTNHNDYWCNAVAGTAPPACTSVTAGSWTLLNGGGGGLADPGANGVMTRTATNVTAPADAAAIAKPMAASVVGGTSDAITITLVPALAAQTQSGTRLSFIPVANNTTTTPTAIVSGLTPLTIKKQSSSGLVPLAVGDIVGAQTARLELGNIGAGVYWVLTNPQTSGGVAGIASSTAHNLIGFADTTGKAAEDSGISATGGNLVVPGSISTSPSGGVGATIAGPEGTVPRSITINGSVITLPQVGYDACYYDSTAHAQECSFNGGAFTIFDGLSSAQAVQIPSSSPSGILRGGSPFTGTELSGDCSTSGSNAVVCTQVNGSNFTVSSGGVPTTIGNLTTVGLGVSPSVAKDRSLWTVSAGTGLIATPGPITLLPSSLRTGLYDITFHLTEVMVGNCSVPGSVQILYAYADADSNVSPAISAGYVAPLFGGTGINDNGIASLPASLARTSTNSGQFSIYAATGTALVYQVNQSTGASGGTCDSFATLETTVVVKRVL
jgi:hypothetical protein